MNWFQRHLIWTMILTGLLWYILAGIEGSGIGWLIGLVVCFLIYGWILTQKRRTLWWLLILFVPFGWIVFIRLENRSRVIDIANGKVITRHRDKSD